MLMCRRNIVCGSVFTVFTVFMLYMARLYNTDAIAGLIDDQDSKTSIFETEYINYDGIAKQNMSLLQNEIHYKRNAMDEAYPSKHVYDVDVLPISDILLADQVPHTVFYVWCGRRWLEFPTYISIMSVIKTLKPHTLIFYYDILPETDNVGYNSWYEEVTELYPFFIPTQLKDTDRGCRGLMDPNPDFIYSKLHTGGLYMNEYIILDNYPLAFKSLDFVVGKFDDSKFAFIQTKGGVPIYKLMKNHWLLGYETKQVKCKTHLEYNNKNKSAICIRAPNKLFPKDIWETETTFGGLVRRYFYGSPVIHLPQPKYDVLIPNVGHIVWLGGGEMDFLFFLGVVSLIYVAEVDMVYIYGDLPPSGPYWKRIKDHQKVQYVYRELPGKVYGIDVKKRNHLSDVWRVDFMVRYGGIYIDTDAVFVRKLDKDIRAYDAVGAYDWPHPHPFPAVINFGIAIGKRNAKYWQLFQESMKGFKDDDFSWNGLRQPYRVKERHPELLLINPHLQVICYRCKCHPTWWPHYDSSQVHHLMSSDSIIDWRNDAYSFHWTQPTPPELKNEKALVVSDSMFADIGRYILYKAGILKEDNRTIVFPNGEKFSFKRPRSVNATGECLS